MSGSSAIILAGGRSSRMGTPKAMLPFDGEPLIAHIVRSFASTFDDIVIVAAPQQELPSLRARIVHDEVAYQGPVGGIVYGLQAAEGELGFVTSCDSAFVNTSLVTHLLSSAHGFDVVVPRWDDRFQPLLSVYRKTVLPFLESQLARGELRPVYLFDRVRTRVVEEEEIRRFDPEGTSFFNMNTPADYESALRRWRELRSEGAVACTVELLGAAQMVAHAREVHLVLPDPATLGDVFAALVARMPSLAGKVIARDGAALLEGYTCNVNALAFVKSASARVAPGDNIAIVSADAGG